jgi:hypothetical protein
MNEQLNPVFKDICNSFIKKDRGNGMGSCEKCWNDAYRKAISLGIPQVEAYHLLLKERENNPCSPEEQAGQFWDEEKQIDTRFSPQRKEQPLTTQALEKG